MKIRQRIIEEVQYVPCVRVPVLTSGQDKLQLRVIENMYVFGLPCGDAVTLRCFW
jgi:hypothetical protein